MEDAHISITDLENNVHLFGVFDGHGGSEVATYVKKNFV
jgi:serine/threonine protein phosphatase PrpC